MAKAAVAVVADGRACAGRGGGYEILVAMQRFAGRRW
jgi:hypothetical protein